MQAAWGIALGFAAIGVLSSCARSGWLLMAANNSNRDVVVRVDSGSTTRVWFLESAGGYWDLEHRADAYPSATLSILDPLTCERLFETALAASSTAIEISPGLPEPGRPFSGRVRVFVSAAEFDPDPTVLAQTDICKVAGTFPVGAPTSTQHRVTFTNAE